LAGVRVVTFPHIERWDQVGRPRGAVHILHGLAEHARRYDRFAAALNVAGFVVWAHDHRGHGEHPVPGPRGHFGDSGGWNALIADASAVSSALQQAYPQLPLFMFAHSMGSFVGQGVVAAHGAAYEGVIFSGTNGPPPFNERLLRTWAALQKIASGGRAPAMSLQKSVFDRYNRPFGPPANSWLSRDPDEVRKYNNDRLCGFDLTLQAWIDLLDGRIAQGSVAFFERWPRELPVLIIAGLADPVGDNGKGVQRLLDRLREADRPRVTYKPYPGARHELTNETNHEDVTADLIRWIGGVL
jgi:alpha-beta hydrolase superfamily lysophospholipase